MISSDCLELPLRLYGVLFRSFFPESLMLSQQMRDGGDTIGNPNDFLNRISQNHLGFEGATGSFSFGDDGERDGFVDVLNWKGNASFVKQWAWSKSLGLHNVVNSAVSRNPLSKLAFFDGAERIPPNQTPRASI